MGLKSREELLPYLGRKIEEGGDISGHLEFLYRLVIESNAQKIVELGTRNADSTCALVLGALETNGHVLSVDHGMGAPYTLEPPTWDALENASRLIREELGLSKFWTLVIEDDLEYAQEYSDEIDILLIDTVHSYEQTKRELELWGRKVVNGGYILIHDTVSYPEQIKAILEFLEMYPGSDYIEFKHCNGLGVIIKETLGARIIHRDEYPQRELWKEGVGRLHEAIIGFRPAIQERTTLTGELEKTKAELSEKNSKIRNLEAKRSSLTGELEKTKAELSEKNSKIRNLESELISIKDSFGYSLMRFYTKIIHELMPDGTKRGDLRKILVVSLCIARKEGVGSLCRQALEKIRKREFHVIEPEIKESKLTTKPIEEDHLAFLLEREEDHTSAMIPSVAIIIPVYGAPSYLKRCLVSVLKNTPSEHEIIIVDDCNSNPEVLEILSSIPPKRCNILRNEKNLGFVKSVNRGIIHAQDKHIVILNQDTEVPPKWIERIVSPITRDPSIASVTPFSNGSTTTSFPEFCEDNEPYLGLDTEDIDLFFQKFGGKPVDIPSAVGFCMALNRRVLSEIGFFDEETFGRGYGEENDWCMRAWKKGYRNVAISNVFVYHKHGASFGDERKKLMQSNLAKVQERHPEYFPWVHNFTAKDPFSSLRNTLKAIIDFNMSKRGRTLCLTHSLGGGSEFTLNTVANLDIADFLTARWDFRTGHWTINTGSFKSNIPDSVFSNGLKKLCEIFRIDHILINQLCSHPDPISLLESIQKCGQPYTFLVNDYFCYCPNWNLIGPSGIYCNLPDLKSCRICLENNRMADFVNFKAYRAVDLEVWRNEWKRFLSKADSVVCFSESSVKLLKDVYPEVETEIVEPVILTQAEEKKISVEKPFLTVGVIGQIGVHKGSKILKELFHITRNDPIRYIIAGGANWIRGPYFSKQVEVTGCYENLEDLARILSSKEVDVVLFPSIWPETYAYVVSEAMLLGYPVISFDLGAPAERIKKTGAGITVKDLSAHSLRGMLLQIVNERSLLEMWTGNTKQFGSPSHIEFLDRWREILSVNTRRGGRKV